MCCSVRTLVLGFPLGSKQEARLGTPVGAEVYITYLECKEEKTERFDAARPRGVSPIFDGLAVDRYLSE
jgi:hypothetical protein